MMPTFSVLPLRRDVPHFLVRGLVLQRHLVAHELQRLRRRARRGAGREDLQAHRRAGLAADQLHDVVETPADHVGVWAVVALADRDDAIVLVSVPAAAAGPPSMMFRMVTYSSTLCSDAPMPS